MDQPLTVPEVAAFLRLSEATVAADNAPATKRPSQPLAERFWAKVDRTGSCWLWTASRNRLGYGQIFIRGKSLLGMAHRVSWELANGPIPEGLLVCHHCDNPPCVNPDHLFLGTDRDNARDAIRKGRMKHGRPTTAKLTDASAAAIHVALAIGTSKAELARRFSVSETLIYNIATGRAWPRSQGESA